MSFSHDLSPWLGFTIDKEWMEENIREGECSLVLYDADAEVEVEAFMPHMHPGGEAYLVLTGEVYDEFGTYPAGSIVWMDPETTHNPKTRERTLILVLWPKGVKIVQQE
jgi:anti-sigma factor ChrR (cupin superfamily)